jgi:SAM-dependent methyltransferase
VTETSAPVEGPDWSSRAAAWVEHWARLAEPARRAVADAAGLRAGVRVLDVGCGSGELCTLAAERGAVVSGIDAAEGMVGIARTRVPDGDLRVGAMERLPWADGSFDVVTAFNAFQFAASPAAALAEAWRVTRPGGLVAICGWGAVADRDLAAVYGALSGSTPADPEPYDLAAAGLEPLTAGEVDVPYESPDLATLHRALVAGAGFDATRAAVEAAAGPFRRADGSYRFENRFRYVVARA